MNAMPAPLDIHLMNLTATVLFVGLLVFAGWACVRWAVRQPMFDVRAIVVRGDVSHNSVASLRANVAPRLSGTFFSMDLGQVRTAFESVPWVRQAIVRREFPARLQVQLQEHKAEAYWGTEGELRLINTFGEVFEANLGEVEQDNLPRLNGPEGQGAEVLGMYRMLVPLFDEMELPVEALELSGGGSWRVHVDTGADIELGRGSTAEIRARVERFLKTLTQVTSRYGRRVTALESADLRHDNGYALRLRGVSTTALTPPTRK